VYTSTYINLLVTVIEVVSFFHVICNYKFSRELFWAVFVVEHMFEVLSVQELYILFSSGGLDFIKLAGPLTQISRELVLI
jgi:hypothetical protein